MKDYKLYKHTNKINGKIYIGITNDTNRRWRNGGIEYKPESSRKSRFWNAIQKYGWESFKHEILISGLSFSEACKLEQKYIAELNCTDDSVGYNIAKGGNGGRVYDHHPRGMLGKPQTARKIVAHRKLLLNPKSNPMKNGKVIWGVTHEHPRGMQGHHQSFYHRQVMAQQTGTKNPNAKILNITFPNGNVEFWPTMKSFVEANGFYKVYELVKSGNPYTVNLGNVKRTNRKVCKHYMGCVFSHR